MKRFWIGLILLQFLAMCHAQMVPVLTRGYDNQRSGWDSHETILNQANVAAKGLVVKTAIPVYGDKRGLEASPLFLTGLQTSRGVRDVMVVCSMANQCRGVDAYDGSAIWDRTLGYPVTSTKQIDMWGTSDHVGCLSTGVIDPDLRRLYQVCWTSPDGSARSGRWYMYVLDVANGLQAAPAILLEGGNPEFNSQMRKQRSSLVEINQGGVKTVVGCSGTIYETAAGAAGYCFAVDVASNTLTAMLPLTKGHAGGVWMAGQGPAADSQGYLYLGTGNGNFNGVDEWGESFLKLRYTPVQPDTVASGAPSVHVTVPGAFQLIPGRPASLAVIDNWTGWTDNARTGNAPKVADKLSGDSAPSGSKMPMNVMQGAKLVATVNAQGAPVTLVYPQVAQGAWADQDWNSAGPACMFQLGICFVGGKDGLIEAINSRHMGQTRPADLLNPKKNCAKLAGPPVFATMDPGPVDPCPVDPRTLNFLPWGQTAHLHMTPVQMYDPLLKSWVLFVWGENNQLHKWAVNAQGQMRYIAQSHEYASGDLRNSPPGGMPGGFCSGSSNGGDANSAILVCTVPRGNANREVVRGDIIAYDPIHLAADGSLKVIWNSANWNWNQSFNKFLPPVINGGQIFVATYSGTVLSLGLSN